MPYSNRGLPGIRMVRRGKVRFVLRVHSTTVNLGVLALQEGEVG